MWGFITSVVYTLVREKLKGGIYGEKIISIEEDTFESSKGCGHYDGFNIVTDKQTIKLGISNEQNCCENWGYFLSEDNPVDFLGSELLRIEVTDTSLNKSNLPEYGLDEGDVMFIDLVTSKGVLQFAAYNEHNGYYGHEAVVISKQLNLTEYL
ncbi:DUF7448 domain-containing protein [Bacillus cereus]|uniref:DUF7448 domain-containing protein n=1 Tax=Bacillus cereus TaxID=1396 RepID=UPI0013D189EA|nr:hypothetical protein [Bacillus cereus]